MMETTIKVLKVYTNVKDHRNIFYSCLIEICIISVFITAPNKLTYQGETRLGDGDDENECNLILSETIKGGTLFPPFSSTINFFRKKWQPIREDYARAEKMKNGNSVFPRNAAGIGWRDDLLKKIRIGMTANERVQE